MQLKTIIKKTSLLMLFPMSALLLNCGGNASVDGNSITDATKNLGDKTKEMAKDAGDMAKDAGEMVKDAGGDMADGIKKAGEGMTDAAEKVADKTMDAGDKLADKVKNAGAKMADKAGTVKDKMADAGDKMADKMKDAGSKAMDKADSMKDKVTNAGSTMKDKVSNATSQPTASQPSIPKATTTASTVKEKVIDKKEEVMPKKEMEDKVIGVDHKAFDALLRKHVSSSGQVNYAGFKSDVSKLDAYLANLSANPVQNSWSRNEKLAYWINAYNANTIKLIVNNYPVSKITDLEGGKPWDKKWIKLGSKTYSLNNIENDIIRPQFKEPRIHFAVNCAAKSCPTLMNKAWFPENLERDFEKMTKAFVNNTSYNDISSGGASISKIFEWYGEDFGDVKAFINKYSSTKVNGSLNFKEYDWSLNGK